MDRYKILIHKFDVNLQTFMSDNIFSLRSIFAELLALKKRHGRAGSGRFMTEMGLGGENTFFLP